jgi:16S rRNA processing protein RimM
VPERVCVGQIGAAHGLRGEVRLRVFTEDPLAIASYGPLENEDGSRRFDIEAVRQAKDHLVARLSGVADRDAAETLRNVRLYIPRDRLPAPEDADTYYHTDLIGLAVIGADGTELGRITAVHNFGAGDILEIRRGAGRANVLLPFTQRTVPDIDLAGGRVVVDPPQGAFDADADRA